MADLVRWLGEQLDEDAARATTAAGEIGSDWSYDAEHGWVLSASRYGAVATGSQDFLERERGEHIAAHDPARVLRGIEAKRAIMALHTQSIRDGGCQVCDVPGGRRLRPDACTTVRMLAAEYADRTGYRAEWRP